MINPYNRNMNIEACWCQVWKKIRYFTKDEIWKLPYERVQVYVEFSNVAYRYRKSISIMELFVLIISIYIEFLASNF